MATRSTITLPVLLALCAPLLTAGCGGDDPGGEAGSSGSTGGTGGPPPTTGDESTGTPTGGEQGFGPESEFTLRLNDKQSDPLSLNMNKAEVAELFGATAKDIALIEVESKTLLTQTLETIKNACGTAWKADDPDPKHNCDLTELGKGKEMVDRLSKLVAIFEGLDFGRNRAEGDDLLGDAYEYLMRHFATESGKSKGQFYTPAEVSRIMASLIGILDALDRYSIETGREITVPLLREISQPSMV